MPLSQLFRYATVTDRLLLGIACAAALINGEMIAILLRMCGAVTPLRTSPLALFSCYAVYGCAIA